MKLEKFKEKNHKRIGVIIFTIACILLISGVIFYRTFAIFEVNETQNIINGKVEDPGDIYFAFYKQDENGKFNIQKEMPTKKDGYVLDESQSYCGVTGRNDSNITVSVSEDGVVHVNGVTTSRTKCNLYFVKGVYILGKGVPIVTEGDGLYEVTHAGLTGTIMDEGFQNTEYRYAGNNPNNYVTFNDETWRIIGLVNVMTSEDTVEQRVKIIKKDLLGNFTWDGSQSSYKNKWDESSLMKMLNNGYYQSSSIETCYKGNNHDLYDKESQNCDFSIAPLKGLNLKARNVIDNNIVWNLGNCDFKTDPPVGMTSEMYICERKNSNNSNYQSTWKGKVAIIYPSDYGYATSDSGDITRKQCIENTSLFDYQACANNNWIYMPKWYFTS